MQRRVYALLCFIMLACLTSCGQHGSASAVPPLASAGGPAAAAGTTMPAGVAATSATTRKVAAIGSNGRMQINLGGPAVGTFVADPGGGGTQYGVSNPIDVSAPNAAPGAVYQTQSYGNMTYVLTGFSPGLPYVVRLHFAEIWYGEAGPKPAVAGQRLFNVALNGIAVLTNFDVEATAGAPDKAVVEDFSTFADSSGQIVVGLTNGSADVAVLNGIEIVQPSAQLAINVGGPAGGSFIADPGGYGGRVFSTSAAIDVSADNAAPAFIYQTERFGPMRGRVPDLIPGGIYLVRMHFADIDSDAGWPRGVGRRPMSATINDNLVLSKFDVLAAAGAQNKAVVRDFTAKADALGSITIAGDRNATISGLEIFYLPDGKPSGRRRVANPVDWSTYGFDLQRTGNNPNEATIGPDNASKLHLHWTSAIGAIDAQPVVAANVNVNGGVTDVVYVGTESGNFYAIDAKSGRTIWEKTIGATSDTADCGPLYVGITGAATFDRATNRVYVAAGPPSGNAVYAYDMSTGNAIPGWPVLVSTKPAAEHIWSSLTLNPVTHTLYTSTASFCDVLPWSGKMVAIDTNAASISATFQSVTTPGDYGGGMWGTGGASIDPSNGNVYTSTGNAEPVEHVDFAESLVRLAPNLQPVASNFPNVPGFDVDFGATPVLYQAPGCPPQLALENKVGVVFVYNRDAISSGPTQQIAFGTYADQISSNVGVLSYSSSTNMLYLANASGSSAYHQGLLAFHVNGDCTISLAWQQQFGGQGQDNAFSSPTIANGIVYVGDGNAGQVFALDASTGKPYWTATVGSNVFSTPTVVNGIVYVASSTPAANGSGGSLYAFGL